MRCSRRSGLRSRGRCLAFLPSGCSQLIWGTREKSCPARWRPLTFAQKRAAGSPQPSSGGNAQRCGKLCRQSPIPHRNNNLFCQAPTRYYFNNNIIELNICFSTKPCLKGFLCRNAILPAPNLLNSLRTPLPKGRAAVYRLCVSRFARGVEPTSFWWAKRPGAKKRGLGSRLSDAAGIN